MRSINDATVSPTGGCPRRLRYVHFLATKRRCQRRIVPGVTKRCFRSIVARPEPARRTPLDPPSPSEASKWLCAARDFVAQHQELDILRRRRATEHQQQVHEPEEYQVEQPQRHGSRSCLSPSAPSTQVSGTGRLLEPHSDRHPIGLFRMGRRGPVHVATYVLVHLVPFYRVPRPPTHILAYHLH